MICEFHDKSKYKYPADRKRYLNKNIVSMCVSHQGLRPSRLSLLVPAVFYLLCLPWKERKKDSRQCPDREIAQSTRLHFTCFRGLMPLEKSFNKSHFQNPSCRDNIILHNFLVSYFFFFFC